LTPGLERANEREVPKLQPDSPLASVVIPCWNAEKFVGDAIRSALDQTHANLEVIVIDDGSTDGSMGVVRSFGDRVRWEAGPNRGACAARNRGLQLANGEVIQFLDADDQLHPTKIERQWTLMQETGADSAFCSVWSHNEGEDSATGTGWAHAQDEDPVCRALGTNSGTSAGLHRREIVERAHGWDESLPCAQDRDFHLRLACLGGQAAVVPDFLATMVRRAGSISSDSLKVFDQYERILYRARATLESRGELTEARSRAMASLLAWAARRYTHAGRRIAAEHYWRVSYSFHERGMDAVYGPQLRPLAHLFGPIMLERLLFPLRSIRWRNQKRAQV